MLAYCEAAQHYQERFRTCRVTLRWEVLVLAVNRQHPSEGRIARSALIFGAGARLSRRCPVRDRIPSFVLHHGKSIQIEPRCRRRASPSHKLTLPDRSGIAAQIEPFETK
jgi:hypothetical protein